MQPRRRTGCRNRVNALSAQRNQHACQNIPAAAFRHAGIARGIAIAATVRRENASAVSLVEHDAPIVLRELCRVRSGRIRLAAEPCKLACVRREHDRLCRSPQYILMPGNRIYTVRIEHNLASSFFKQGTHDFGQRIRTAESAPDEQRVRLFGKRKQLRQCVHGKQPVFILRHGPHDRLIQLDRQHRPRTLRNCKCHNAAAHAYRALRGEIRRACISRRAAHAQNAAVVVFICLRIARMQYTVREVLVYLNHIVSFQVEAAAAFACACTASIARTTASASISSAESAMSSA